MDITLTKNLPFFVHGRVHLYILCVGKKDTSTDLNVKSEWGGFIMFVSSVILPYKHFAKPL